MKRVAIIFTCTYDSEVFQSFIKNFESCYGEMGGGYWDEVVVSNDVNNKMDESLIPNWCFKTGHIWSSDWTQSNLIMETFEKVSSDLNLSGEDWIFKLDCDTAHINTKLIDVHEQVKNVRVGFGMQYHSEEATRDPDGGVTSWYGACYGLKAKAIKTIKDETSIKIIMEEYLAPTGRPAGEDLMVSRIARRFFQGQCYLTPSFGDKAMFIGWSCDHRGLDTYERYSLIHCGQTCCGGKNRGDRGANVSAAIDRLTDFFF